jgi:hypothetical protein
MNEYTENKIVCVQSCKNLAIYKYKYINRCYIQCPPNTTASIDTFICEQPEIITSSSTSFERTQKNFTMLCDAEELFQ